MSSNSDDDLRALASLPLDLKIEEVKDQFVVHKSFSLWMEDIDVTVSSSGKTENCILYYSYVEWALGQPLTSKRLTYSEFLTHVRQLTGSKSKKSKSFLVSPNFDMSPETIFKARHLMATCLPNVNRKPKSGRKSNLSLTRKKKNVIKET